MNEKNRELLEKVIESRLKDAKTLSNSEERDKALRDAMAAVDRSNRLTELDISKKEHEERLNFDKESKEKDYINRKVEILVREKEDKKNRIIRIIEVAAVPVSICIINIISRNRFAKKICNFEKDYTFTTTPGRSLKDVFRFK